MKGMVQVSEGAINEVGQAIVNALLAGRDHRGQPVALETIDPAHLRAIAIGALQMAADRVIWPRGLVLDVDAEEKVPFLRKVYPTR